MTVRVAGLVVAMLAGCGTGRRSVAGAAPVDCPPATTASASIRYGTVVLDGTVIARTVTFRREGDEPPSYTIVGQEPPELAAVPVTAIDLVRYAEADEVDSSLSSGCPGTVVMMVSTRGQPR